MSAKTCIAKTTALLALALSIVVTDTKAAQAADNLCAAPGYTLAFFSGAWSMPEDAMMGAVLLAQAVGNEQGGQPISPEVFYNASGINANGTTRTEDLLDSFASNTATLNSTLGTRWELYWDILKGDTSAWKAIITAMPEADAISAALQVDVNAEKIAWMSQLLFSPPKATDYTGQISRIKALITERRKLLLVGHSAGNAFLRTAYAAALTQTTDASVKVVHIASPIALPNAGYHLSRSDNIMLLLKLLVSGITRNITMDLVDSGVDITGHELVATYLDPKREGLAAIAASMREKLAALQEPTTQGNPGFFSVTLTWNGTGDVDLHMFEPNGSHVYYDIQKGSTGALDLDSIAGYGPEHYAASCNPADVQLGKYAIHINNFDSATGRTATVQLASATEGELKTTLLDVGPQLGRSGDGVPLHVFDVLVSKDANGKLVVTAD